MNIEYENDIFSIERIVATSECPRFQMGFLDNLASIDAAQFDPIVYIRVRDMNTVNENECPQQEVFRLSVFGGQARCECVRPGWWCVWFHRPLDVKSSLPGVHRPKWFAPRVWERPG